MIVLTNKEINILEESGWYVDSMNPLIIVDTDGNVKELEEAEIIAATELKEYNGYCN